MLACLLNKNKKKIRRVTVYDDERVTDGKKKLKIPSRRLSSSPRTAPSGRPWTDSSALPPNPARADPLLFRFAPNLQFVVVEDGLQAADLRFVTNNLALF